MLMEMMEGRECRADREEVGVIFQCKPVANMILLGFWNKSRAFKFPSPFLVSLRQTFF